MLYISIIHKIYFLLDTAYAQDYDYYPAGRKASAEVAKLTERKNPHIHVCGVFLSVHKFNTNYLRTGRTE